MKKRSFVRNLIILGTTILSFSSPVLAFTGNKPHTQTLIVSSTILNDKGKLIDPEGNAPENKDDFVITVHFSNLKKGDEIDWGNKTLKSKKDGTAEVTYKAGNCTPKYFDNVPVTAKIVVTEDASNYKVSYKTTDFADNVKDKTEKAHTALSTQELTLQEGKDGTVLFSNQKGSDIPGLNMSQEKAMIIVILIFLMLAAGILMQ